MRKRRWLFSLCLSLLLTSNGINATLNAAPEEKKLFVYGWANNIDPAVLARFKKETGINVVFDVFDSDEIPEAKLLMGKTGYDLITPSNPYFARQIKLGLYQPLDKTLLPNVKHMDPQILGLLESIDPNNTHGLPLTWGTIGYGYNVQKVKERVPNANLNSAQMVLNPDTAQKLADCGIVLLDLPQDVIDGVLYTFGGQTSETHHQHDTEKAIQQLEKVRPYIKRFHNSPEQVTTNLLEEEACIVQAFSGDILRTRAEAKAAHKPFDIAYTIPQEGTNGWIDVMAIPHDAAHPKNAHAFLNFLMQPDVAVQNALYSMQATPNLTAKKLLPQVIQKDPALYPDAQTMKRIHLPPPRDLPQERDLTRRWYKFKLGI